jgi:hypothetical protein
VNVGARYLDGAFNFDGNAAADYIRPELAARIVWFDAFVSNPDRTHRNPNLMIWERKPYLIDHGAALYPQHDWPSVDDARTRSPFQLVRDHVLLAQSGNIASADAELAPLMSAETIGEALQAIPDELLTDASIRSDFATPAEARERYARYLTRRAESPRAFVEEAITAQERAAKIPALRVSSRR